MLLDAQSVVRWVKTVLSEAHRGVLPQFGKLVAFGNRGQDEVVDFRAWLGEKGYDVEEFASEDDSWVMVIDPPSRMKDTRAVTKALWDASLDHPLRKAVQFNIADLHIRLVFARQCMPLGRSSFTKREVRELGAVLFAPLHDLGIREEAGTISLPGRATAPGRGDPSLN